MAIPLHLNLERVIKLCPLFIPLLFAACMSRSPHSPENAVPLHELSAGRYPHENVEEEIMLRGAIYHVKAGETFRFTVRATGNVFTTEERSMLEFHFKKDSFLYIPPDMNGIDDLRISHDGKAYHPLASVRKNGNLIFNLDQLRDGISANLDIQYTHNF